MPFLGEIAALTTACLWSGSSLSFAAATKRVAWMPMNVARLVMAVIMLALVLAAARLEIHLSPTQVEYLAISGIVGFAFGDSFLFQAFQKLGARHTMLLMSLAPAVAALLAFLFLGEGLSAVGLLGIALTIFGIGFVLLDRGEPLNGEGMAVTTAGIVFGVLAAIGQGSGLVLAKMAFREGLVNGFVATMVRIASALIVLLPLIMFSKPRQNPLSMFNNDRRALLFTFLGSTLGPFLGVACSLVAIQYTKVGIAATLMSTTPILLLPLVRIIHHERPTRRAYIGTFIAVAGIAVLFLR